MLQVIADSAKIAAEQQHIHLKQHLPEGWQQPTKQQDVQELPAFKQAEKECRVTKPAVRQYLMQRRSLLLRRQAAIAARYNANFEEQQKSKL